jgi:hypothetical protein
MAYLGQSLEKDLNEIKKLYIEGQILLQLLLLTLYKDLK